MNKKSILLWGALAVLVVLGPVAGFVLGRYYVDNKKANFTEDYVLYVYPDMTVDQVLDSLQSGAGAIRPKSLERAFAKVDARSRMKPGRYVVEPSSTSIYVARMVVFGWQTPQNLTLSGTIRSKGVLAKKIGMQMMVDSAAVAAALENKEFLAGYGFTPEDVFGLVLPDTYQMYWTASVQDIFDRFKKEYDAFWTSERIAKAEAQGLTRKEVSVVASIVSGDTLK